MKAAFLLLSTSWLVGADTPPPPPALAPAAPAHVVPAPVVGACPGGNCGAAVSSCDSCCETTWCEQPGLFARLRDRFRKSDCCDSCGSAPVTTCAPACDTCEDSCKESLFDRLRGRFHRSSCCEPAPCETTCGSACDDGCHGGGGLFARLRARFSRGNDCCDSCDSCGHNGGHNGAYYPGHGTVISTTPIHPVPGAPVHGAPVPGAPAVQPEQIQPPKEGADKLPADGKEASVTPAQSLQSETKYPFDLGRQYVSRAGHATDYSWLTGQLFYVHVDGGQWVLRYAPLSTEDPNGGGVVVARDRNMDSYRDGDLVRVNGAIIAPKGSMHLGAPLYRVSSIQLLDRESH